MAGVTYKLVEHDGGWAYKVGDVFSETFRTREEAHDAAEAAAAEQRRAGDDATIEFEDDQGHWRRQASRGDDRPETNVED